MDEGLIEIVYFGISCLLIMAVLYIPYSFFETKLKERIRKTESKTGCVLKPINRLERFFIALFALTVGAIVLYILDTTLSAGLWVASFGLIASFVSISAIAECVILHIRCNKLCDIKMHDDGFDKQ